MEILSQTQKTINRFGDGCNTCDCGVDGSAEFPRCTEIACTFPTRDYFCDTCAEGFYFDDNGDCVDIPTCGGIDFCTKLVREYIIDSKIIMLPC